MKKLLTLFGALGLSATGIGASASVVSCGGIKLPALPKTTAEAEAGEEKYEKLAQEAENALEAEVAEYMKNNPNATEEDLKNVIIKSKYYKDYVINGALSLAYEVQYSRYSYTIKTKIY